MVGCQQQVVQRGPHPRRGGCCAPPPVLSAATVRSAASEPKQLQPICVCDEYASRSKVSRQQPAVQKCPHPRRGGCCAPLPVRNAASEPKTYATSLCVRPIRVLAKGKPRTASFAVVPASEAGWLLCATASPQFRCCAPYPALSAASEPKQLQPICVCGEYAPW